MDPAMAKEVATMAKYRAVDDAIARGNSEVRRFYDNAVVFITGGSGFLGKQLIEKLFRSSDIKKVFLLMRHKKKRAFHERLNFILQDPVFDTVRKTKPDFASRIQPVQGDVAEPRLGISDEDWELIINETDIIIHGAATINFEEHIRIATFTNVRGTVEMLKLAKLCTKLRSYVHISTAYSHATVSRINKDVSEQFYDAPVSPKVMIEMAESVSDQRLQDITPKLIQNWPNTYTFTKAIAEEAVRQMSEDLPICIVRPAIVAASYREHPGWLDISCAYGPSGLILGVGTGVMHSLQADEDIKIDIVPVDIVNNAVIAAGWWTAKRRAGGDKDVKIYTVTNLRNPSRWGHITNTLNTHVKYNYATPRAIYYPFVTITKHKWLYLFLAWLWHYIPAYVIDAGLWVAGKEPIAIKLYNKATKLTQVLSYFTTHEWLSSDKNLQELQQQMTPTDQLIYNFDVSTIDWTEYMVIWGLGIRKYIIKDKLEGTEYALKKQSWLRVVHYIVSALYFYLLYKVIALSLSLTTTALSYVF